MKNASQSLKAYGLALAILSLSHSITIRQDVILKVLIQREERSAAYCLFSKTLK
jgi:hypothetical protein